MDASLVSPGFASVMTLASACKRFARVTMPTSLSSRTTGTRLIWWRSIRCTISSEPTVFFYRSHVRSHHVTDLAARRLQILCGQASWTHQKFDPTPALPLCPRFRPPDEIPLCYDPNQSAPCIHDRQAAEFALQHQPDGDDRSVRGNAHGIRGHDVSGPHCVSSSFEFRAYLSASARPLYDGKKF